MSTDSNALPPGQADLVTAVRELARSVSFLVERVEETNRLLRASTTTREDSEESCENAQPRRFSVIPYYFLHVNFPEGAMDDLRKDMIKFCQRGRMTFRFQYDEHLGATDENIILIGFNEATIEFRIDASHLDPKTQQLFANKCKKTGGRGRIYLLPEEHFHDPGRRLLEAIENQWLSGAGLGFTERFITHDNRSL
jgi:hypothetical protein